MVFRRSSLILLLALVAPPLWSAPGLTGILSDLGAIEAEMTANQGRIDALQAEIGQLQALGHDAAIEIQRLQTLVTDHAARVQQLGDRYAQVLTLAQRQKQELEQSSVLNWALGGTALVAVLVALGEGLALAGR